MTTPANLDTLTDDELLAMIAARQAARKTTTTPAAVILPAVAQMPTRLSTASLIVLASALRGWIIQKEAAKLAAERNRAAFGDDAQDDPINFELGRLQKPA